MAKTTVKQTGLANAEGSFGGGLRLWDVGKYLMELATYTLKEKRQDPDDEGSAVTGYSHIFQCMVDETEDGLEQQSDGTESFGGSWYHTVFVPTPEHGSYSENWYKRSLGQLKATLDGFRIPVSKSDNFDATAHYGAKAWVELTQYTPKNETTPRNGVRSMTPADE